MRDEREARGGRGAQEMCDDGLQLEKPTLGTSVSCQHLFAARFSLIIHMPALISSNDFVRPISF